MTAKADREGLSLGYRIGYRLQYLVLHLFGPAQLGDAENPHVQLQRRRAAKVAAARQARLEREAPRGPASRGESTAG